MIHRSSEIDKKAKISKNVKIGPFCYVSSDCVLEDNIELFSHVSIVGKTLIGKNTKVWPFASIGHYPQDLKYKGENNELIIGADNKIRESVSINPGTKGGGGTTKIGNNCLFMPGSHIGHDCQLGNGIILANNAALAGHVSLGDNVTIGGVIPRNGTFSNIVSAQGTLNSTTIGLTTAASAAFTAVSYTHLTLPTKRIV